MTPAPPSRSRSGEARRERRSRETRPLLRALLKRWSMSRGDHELASSGLSPVVGPASSILSDTSSRRNSRRLSSGQSSHVPHYLPAGRGVLSQDPTAAKWRQAGIERVSASKSTTGLLPSRRSSRPSAANRHAV